MNVYEEENIFDKEKEDGREKYRVGRCILY